MWKQEPQQAKLREGKCLPPQRRQRDKNTEKSARVYSAGVSEWVSVWLRCVVWKCIADLGVLLLYPPSTEYEVLYTSIMDQSLDISLKWRFCVESPQDSINLTGYIIMIARHTPFSPCWMSNHPYPYQRRWPIGPEAGQWSLSRNPNMHSLYFGRVSVQGMHPSSALLLHITRIHIPCTYYIISYPKMPTCSERGWWPHRPDLRPDRR